MRERSEKRIFLRSLWALALPIALQSLMLASVAAGDALMLGRVSQSEMTAVSLATQVQFVQNMILTAITGAGAILGAQYWGKGDRRTMKELFNLMLRAAGLLSLAFFAACRFMPELLMGAFTHDGELLAIGGAYLRTASWSYLITGLSQCYITVLKVSGRVSESAWISSGAVLLNLGLNAVFIFGLLGAPRMNARGAALATDLARGAELGLCLLCSAGPGRVRPGWDRFFRLPKLLRRDFLRQCLPLLGGALFWGVGFTSYTAILGHVGSDPAAANSVASVVRDLICCVCNGIAGAAAILVGNALGAGDLERGRSTGVRLMRLSFLIGFGSTLVILALTPLVLNLVLLNEAARGYLRGMMVIMAVYMIGRCVNTVTINGILDAGGDTLFDFYSLAVCMWGIAIPLAALGAFVFHWNPLAVYACTCLDEVGKIPWVIAHFYKYRWVQNLTREREIEPLGKQEPGTGSFAGAEKE